MLLRFQQTKVLLLAGCLLVDFTIMHMLQKDSIIYEKHFYYLFQRKK